jgi:hypothetical protein
MNTPDESGAVFWRYTVWVPMDNQTARVDWTRQTYDELYNLTGDVWTSGTKNFDSPSYFYNVASDHPALVSQFRAHMRQQVNSWY